MEGNSHGIRICPPAELEYAIESRMSAFVAVGDAFMAIPDERLYRRDYPTWKASLRDCRFERSDVTIICERVRWP